MAEVGCAVGQTGTGKAPSLWPPLPHQSLHQPLFSLRRKIQVYMSICLVLCRMTFWQKGKRDQIHFQSKWKPVSHQAMQKHFECKALRHGDRCVCRDRAPTAPCGTFRVQNKHSHYAAIPTKFPKALKALFCLISLCKYYLSVSIHCSSNIPIAEIAAVSCVAFFFSCRVSVG